MNIVIIVPAFKKGKFQNLLREVNLINNLSLSNFNISARVSA